MWWIWVLIIVLFFIFWLIVCIGATIYYLTTPKD
jgi:hypothetical protein